MKKFGRNFKLQKEILKTEMNHDEVDSKDYKDKKHERLDYVKQDDVFCTAFSYARKNNAMYEVTGFSTKDSSSAPGLGWKYFNSMRVAINEPIYFLMTNT